jgi:hypothetical protein
MLAGARPPAAAAAATAIAAVAAPKKAIPAPRIQTADGHCSHVAYGALSDSGARFSAAGIEGGASSSPDVALLALLVDMGVGAAAAREASSCSTVAAAVEHIEQNVQLAKLKRQYPAAEQRQAAQQAALAAQAQARDASIATAMAVHDERGLAALMHAQEVGVAANAWKTVPRRGDAAAASAQHVPKEATTVLIRLHKSKQVRLLREQRRLNCCAALLS